jgi:catechol 2,3-dioxygenase-like lactoylglutathione lyase family enzyme
LVAHTNATVVAFGNGSSSNRVMRQPTYVPPTEQLVVEIFVSDLERSISFYEHLGFKKNERHDRFASLTWEEHQIFLDERRELPPVPADQVRANVRIMVRDVNAAWERMQALGVPVAQPIEDRAYGLRDFTVIDPDGFGVRFATRLGS